MTMAVVAVVSVLKGTNWNALSLGLHVLSLGVVVAVYRVYVSYQTGAPQRLQLSRRLRNQQ
jgi:hypothetical protein